MTIRVADQVCVGLIWMPGTLGEQSCSALALGAHPRWPPVLPSSPCTGETEGGACGSERPQCSPGWAGLSLGHPDPHVRTIQTQVSRVCTSWVHMSSCAHTMH